jgi:glutamine synthetase
LGLSKLAYQFLGGLKAHAKAVTAVTAPTVNSYKRLVKKSPNSGATWAPVYITYGGSNRTQMIRIPAPGRLENRTVDGAINPYLATAVMLAAGLDGVKRNLPEGKANVLNLYDVPEEELAKAGIETLPQSLNEALDFLEADKVVLEALGAEYGPYYVDVKRAEWKRYHNFVSDWEKKTYLENF